MLREREREEASILLPRLLLPLRGIRLLSSVVSLPGGGVVAPCRRSALSLLHACFCRLALCGLRCCLCGLGSCLCSSRGLLTLLRVVRRPRLLLLLLLLLLLCLLGGLLPIRGVVLRVVSSVRVLRRLASGGPGRGGGTGRGAARSATGGSGLLRLAGGRGLLRLAYEWTDEMVCALSGTNIIYSIWSTCRHLCLG